MEPERARKLLVAALAILVVFFATLWIWNRESQSRYYFTMPMNTDRQLYEIFAMDTRTGVMWCRWVKPMTADYEMVASMYPDVGLEEKWAQCAPPIPRGENSPKARARIPKSPPP